MNGYDTQTFSELVVDHLKPRNIAEGGLIRRKWQVGLRDYALGHHPVFEVAKCFARWNERPYLIGAFARLVGFLWATIRRRRRALPLSLVVAARDEQMRRMFGAFRR